MRKRRVVFNQKQRDEVIDAVQLDKLTVNEAAEMYGTSTRIIYTWIKKFGRPQIPEPPEPPEPRQEPPEPRPIPEPSQIDPLESFISGLENLISAYKRLKTERENYKASMMRWQCTAGKLNEDIQRMFQKEK